MAVGALAEKQPSAALMAVYVLPQAASTQARHGQVRSDAANPSLLILLDPVDCFARLAMTKTR